MQALVLSVAVAALAAYLPLPAHAILLDSAFGSGGKVADDTMRGGTEPVVDPDTGRIFVLAELAADSDTVIAAYLADGTPDTSFGTDGRLVLFGPTDPDLRHLALQPDDGKLVVAISAGSCPGCLVRYDGSGALDPSFGTGGIVSMDEDLIYPIALALQDDGKILVAGAPNAFDPVSIARFLSDGTPDPGFGTAGLVVVGDLDDGLQINVLTASGGTIAAGGDFLSAFQYVGLAVGRYLDDGSPDPDFGTNGVVVTSFGGPYSFPTVSGLVRQADDKLVALAATDPVDQFSSYSKFAALRFLPDGTLDPSYGSSGILDVPIGGQELPRGVLDAAGGVLVTSAKTVARLTEDGALDRDFAPCVVSAIPFEHGYGAGLAVQPDGKLVVVGGRRPPMEGLGFFPTSFRMVRYTMGDPTCHAAAPEGSRISSRTYNSYSSLQKFKWKWKSSGPVSLSDFGAPPPGDRLTACIVDARDASGLRNLKIFDLTGFRTSSVGYKGRVGRFTLKLRPGAAGKARIYFVDELSHSEDFLYVAPMTVRLDRSGSPSCWEAQFATLRKNSPVTVSATSD